MSEKLETEYDLDSDSLELQKFMEKILSDPGSKRIDPLDFIGLTKNFRGEDIPLFKEGEVMTDISAVREKKERIESQAHSLSDSERAKKIAAGFVEVMIPQAIKDLDWLGKRIGVITPSLYDDYFRGIDLALQIMPDRIIRGEGDLRCLGFSVDFTISREEAEDKMRREMWNVIHMMTPRMKYFKVEVKTEQGVREIKLKNFKIPKVVMTCTGKSLEEAKEDFMVYENDTEDPLGRANAINNPLRFHFINETLAQLKLLFELAKKVQNTEAQKVYGDSLAAFEEVVAELEINPSVMAEVAEKIPSLISRGFDLDTPGGEKMINILRNLPEGFFDKKKF